ncbi:MAG: SagB/ThcOx family dehydrogenase [Dysgonomonas sp.]
MKKLLVALSVLAVALVAQAQSDIKLPDPVKTGGKPLMEVLNQRQSIKTYSGKTLDNQTLSNLLWAAYGFNREDKRVVPSSQNRQEIDVYVLLTEGIYFYDAKANTLVLKVAGNHKEALGQPAVSDNAALSLVYVANLDKASNRETAFLDTGFSVQDVYLYAASAGLGALARGSFKKDDLTKIMKLTSTQEITLVQAVGYSK